MIWIIRPERMFDNLKNEYKRQKERLEKKYLKKKDR